MTHQRSPVVDEFMAAFRVVMSTRSGDLFLAAISRVHELLPEMKWDELRPDESQWIMLQAVEVSMVEEWGDFDSRDDVLRAITKYLRSWEAMYLMVPEVYSLARRVANS